LSRPELIKQLKQKKPELNQSDLETVIVTFCESIEKALKNNGYVELRGFGTFFVKKVKENYSARNPKTGELIYVPEKNKVRFRASKKLKEFINK
jgi:integration host factor subunit beta